jgi:hypothetical protein
MHLSFFFFFCVLISAVYVSFVLHLALHNTKRTATYHCTHGHASMTHERLLLLLLLLVVALQAKLTVLALCTLLLAHVTTETFLGTRCGACASPLACLVDAANPGSSADDFSTILNFKCQKQFVCPTNQVACGDTRYIQPRSTSRAYSPFTKCCAEGFACASGTLENPTKVSDCVPAIVCDAGRSPCGRTSSSGGDFPNFECCKVGETCVGGGGGNAYGSYCTVVPV